MPAAQASARDAEWEASRERLEEYSLAHGHCRVSRMFMCEDGFQLGPWVATQRSYMRDGRLCDSRIAALDAVGFVWDAAALQDAEWRGNFDAYVAFVAANGHGRVPRTHAGPAGSRATLGLWVRLQREARKAKTLNDARRALLEDAGFVWDAHADTWRSNLALLAAYVDAHGDAHVPRSHKTLGEWVINQRKVKKRGALAADRAAALEKLGFAWSPPVGRKRKAGPAPAAAAAAAAPPPADDARPPGP